MNIENEHDQIVVDKILAHQGHKIECVSYGQGDEIANVALECMKCHEVIIDYDLDNPNAPAPQNYIRMQQKSNQ